jgi:hypothetical protein
MFKEIFTEAAPQGTQVSKWPSWKDQTEKADLYTLYDKVDIRKLLKANTSGNSIDNDGNNETYAPASDNRFFVLLDNAGEVQFMIDSGSTMKGAKKFDVYELVYGTDIMLTKNLTLAKVQKMLKDSFNQGWGPLFKIKWGK